MNNLYIVIALTVFIILLVYILIKKYRQIGEQNRDASLYKELYDRLDMMFQNAKTDLAIYDSEGDCIVRLNKDQRAESKSYKDLLGENLFQNRHLPKEVQEAIKSRKSINTEISIDPINMDNNSEKEFFQFIFNPIQERDSEMKYMLATVDLTSIMKERKEKERLEKLLEFASDSFSVGLAYYNLFDNTGMANDSWYDNLNETPKEKIESSYTNVISSDRSILWAYLEKMKYEKMDPLQRDIQVKGKDDMMHWIRQYIFQIDYVKDSRKTQVIELNINIDKQKGIENRLNEAMKEAERANKETEEFLSNISHEVRTPLNAISGFSNVLASSSEQDEIEQLSEIIMKNNALLTQLIYDILELSRFDSGKVALRRDTIDLNELMEEMFEYTKGLLKNKGVETLVQYPEKTVSMITDRQYLILVLHHLLDNAVKFTEKGSISLGYFQKGKDYMFFVENTGSKIPEDKYEVIFKRFEKIDSFAQGSGLGLPLCKTIIQFLGGEMGVTSLENDKTQFWFVLPSVYSPSEENG